MPTAAKRMVLSLTPLSSEPRARSTTSALPRAWWIGSGSPFLYELGQTTEVSHSGEASMTIASEMAIETDIGMLISTASRACSASTTWMTGR